MSVSHRQLQAFVAVAQTRSFGAAAGKIGLSQPALSLAIKSLEERLGGPLIDRSSRNCALTAEGASFLPVAARLIDDWDAAVEDAQSLFAMQRGRVSVAALPSIAVGYLATILTAYMERHPRIDIEIFDVTAGRVLDLVRDRRADFGISTRPSDGRDIAFEPLLSERYMVVHAPDHPIAALERVPARMLEAFPFIALSRSSSVRRGFDEATRDSALSLRPLVEVEQLSTAATLVLRNGGVTAVPESCLPLMRVHGLRAAPLHDPEIRREIGLLTATGRPLPVATEALLKMARAAISENGTGTEPKPADAGHRQSEKQK